MHDLVDTPQCLREDLRIPDIAAIEQDVLRQVRPSVTMDLVLERVEHGHIATRGGASALIAHR